MRRARIADVMSLALLAAGGCGGADPNGGDDALTGHGGKGGANARPTGDDTSAGEATAGTGAAGRDNTPVAMRAGASGASAGAAGATVGMAGNEAVVDAGATSGATAPAVDGGGSLFPIETGNSWTFRTTKGSSVGSKTQTVDELEMVGGTGPNSETMAYRMTTSKDDGLDKTESWQAEVEGKIVRYRERSYAASNGELEIEEHWDPYKLRIDATQLTVGATYTEEYAETKLVAGAAPATANASDAWRVVAIDEMVTVPAGTFSAVVIEKVGGTSTKRYWFVRGVGKVKEQSGAQLEELTSYMLMP
jgi:hypothetical protein